jgi:hypothetical protein
LELCYGLLYAVAPISVGVLYLYRQRRRVDTFLSCLLLGTLITYLLLPYFPSLSPRVAFPGQDLPAYDTPFRRLNLWLLNNCDIRASVFPSGHVTLGFSAAFAMFVAMPERRHQTGIQTDASYSVGRQNQLWVDVTLYRHFHVSGADSASRSCASRAAVNLLNRCDSIGGFYFLMVLGVVAVFSVEREFNQWCFEPGFYIIFAVQGVYQDSGGETHCEYGFHGAYLHGRYLRRGIDSGGGSASANCLAAAVFWMIFSVTVAASAIIFSIRSGMFSTA